MNPTRTKATGLLRQFRNLAPGTLIGSGIATPALAAIDISAIPVEQWAQPVLIGSLILLVIGLALKAKHAKKTPPPVAPTKESFGEGIGRYRPQLGR